MKVIIELYRYKMQSRAEEKSPSLIPYRPIPKSSQDQNSYKS